ncbi:class I poly(R)-hydroxyalkanoic acid synthase [Chitinimonas arctica]|uniref:Class I poly(R)-hydroxyalkanoic acid synthase n=2 Tax=Chitinimonas arctica TaxID=2594795 RepID=A0A516SM58_9NEIS|nr:class I poly(R)-hydroxyalkanoic acid synthase [Chitinimonas arctica]
MGELAQRWQKLWQAQLQQQLSGQPRAQVPDPQSIQHTFEALWRAVLEKPAPMLQAQADFWRDYGALTEQAMRQYWQGEAVPTGAADKRFKDELWNSNPLFGFIKQAYLLTARHIQASVDAAEGLDPGTSRRAAFYTRQFVDAMAPTNFLAGNPTALKATLESGGENLFKGFTHLLEDLERNDGRLMPRMTDLGAFRLGEHIATTPGKVVFQNALMQLIQYAPATGKVHRTPLLVVPPWINKFYILDLKPKNSLLKWLVEQGHTVFVISWVNPDARHRDQGFEDYMRRGVLAALDAIAAATGEQRVNAAAYCIGGTLLAASLAYMAAANDKSYPASRIKSAAFFTTMIDFSEPGELGVFIDEEQLGGLDRYMEEKGYLEGHQMAGVFNLLRENDLIWSFVVNNYLLGREPMPFDLLYWNCDSTRMPAAMHRFYLRKMYLENVLKDAGGVVLGGVPIDMRRIKTPAYFISAREDHIAPWQSTYAGARLLQGPVRFVLGGSGHIAGIVNPPSANKYGYAINPALPATPAEWLAGSSAQEGSWWTDWQAWLQPFVGKPIAAREPGGGGLAAIEDAPGSYVRAKLD